MNRQNVLLVVWDACRLDAARFAAPNLRRLASENLWFENAVAPAGQSLGSHVSMFTGEYPHEHDIYRQTDLVEEPLSLLEKLGDGGYDRYAVSANGFAAPKYGFDRGFDAFYNTQGLTVYPDGLDVHEYARRVREESGGTFSIDDVDYGELIYELFSHAHPLKSLANVGAAVLSESTTAYPVLQRIPHPRFDQYNEFCYDPNRNTRLVSSVLDEAAASDEPFFLFTNYMDPHHPYAPPARNQREYCGRTFPYRELSELSEVYHPWSYLERVRTTGQLDEETLETIRRLYRAEVRTADDHLGRLLAKLDRTGLREETLVVVVADHGENLGEENWMGERHMGHVRSASEHHLRVPMVVAHPALEQRTVHEEISPKNLYRLFTDGMETVLETGGRDVTPLRPETGVVSCEIPRTTTDLADWYPELAHILRRHLSASYADGWKVVVSSTGDEHAWVEGTERPVEDAPERAIEASRESVESLTSTTDSERGLSDAERSHMEALGYL